MSLRHLVLRISFCWDIMDVTGQSVSGVSKKKSKTFKSLGSRGVLCSNQLRGSLSPMHGVSSDRRHKPTEQAVDKESVSPLSWEIGSALKASEFQIPRNRIVNLRAVLKASSFLSNYKVLYSQEDMCFTVLVHISENPLQYVNLCRANKTG
jgi:hypothetical protein